METYENNGNNTVQEIITIIPTLGGIFAGAVIGLAEQFNRQSEFFMSINPEFVNFSLLDKVRSYFVANMSCRITEFTATNGYGIGDGLLPDSAASIKIPQVCTDLFLTWSPMLEYAVLGGTLGIGVTLITNLILNSINKNRNQSA